MKLSSKHSVLFMLMFALIILTGCDKKETINLLPILSTTNASTITENTTQSGGIITSDAGSSISSRGICWGITSNPTIADNKTVEGTGIGTFTSSITGLTAGTVYYIRAYASNSAGTGYGNTITFKTLTAATTFSDIDGNTYKTVNIGTQTWMAENLRTTKYRTGEGITNVKVDSIWKIATYGAWCDYNNDAVNGAKYGKLYNWAAVNDSRKIAPIGWHIPTVNEWETLITFMGGENGAGAKLKEIGISNWNMASTGVSNSSGFTALPGGSRDDNGIFATAGRTGFWWCATEHNSTTGDLRKMNSDDNAVQNDYKSKQYGLSVRCIKDAN